MTGAVVLLANVFVLVTLLYFAVFVYPHRPWSEETLKRSRSFVSNAFFREYWYFLMGPLKRKFLDWNLSPNTLTVLGAIFSVLCGVLLCFRLLPEAGWALVLAGTCDVYDGMLARAKGLSMKSGAFLDSVLDRAGEGAFFMELAWIFREDVVFFVAVFLAFTGSQVVSYARARAEGLGFGGTRGFFQRAERLIVLSVGLCSGPLWEKVGVSAWDVLKATVVVLCVGSTWTALSRSISIFREMRADDEKALG